MSVTVRGVAVTEGNTGTTGYDITVTLPAYEVGDSLYAFYAGEWQEADTASGAWVRFGRDVSTYQSGALFTRVATGDDELVIGINPEGDADFAVVVVATVGRTYLELLGSNAQTSTPDGSQFPVDDFSVYGSANPGNAVMHFLSAGSPYFTDPSAPGDLLAPLTHGEWDGAVAGLWLSRTTADTDPDTLHLPVRSASFWLSARIYQAIVTYEDETPQTLERTGGVGTQQGDGAPYNSMGWATVHTDTATHGELPSSGVLRDIQSDAADLFNRASGIFPYFSGEPAIAVAFGTDTEHLPGDPSTEHYYEAEGFTNTRPIEVHRRNVPDTDHGVLMWAPLDTETPPDGALGWEWLDDPNDQGSREAVLTGVVLTSQVQGSAPDNLDTPELNKTALVYQNSGYTVTADLDEAATVRVTAWTPDDSKGLMTLDAPAQSVEVDLTARLDMNGDALLWHVSPATADTPEMPAAELTYSVPASGTSLYYGWLTDASGDVLTVTWEFVTPAWRWITSLTEVIGDLPTRVRKVPIAPLRRVPAEKWHRNVRRAGGYF